jgi:VWFA-related protein
VLTARPRDECRRCSSRNASCRGPGLCQAVYASVRDRSGHVVTGLTREAFRIREDGRPADIVLFSSDPQPVAVAVMIQSGVLIPAIARVREAVHELLDVLGEADRVSVGTIGREIAVSPALPPSHPELRRVLADDLWIENQSLLWPGLERAIDRIADEPRRRVLLVLSNDWGRNWCYTPSVGAACGSMAHVAQRIEHENVLVYRVVIEGTSNEPGPGRLPTLQTLVDRTAGLRMSIGAGDDVGTVVRRIADELRQQYLLGFRPRALDGRRHRIAVEITEPGLSVRARSSYVAPIR